MQENNKPVDLEKEFRKSLSLEEITEIDNASKNLKKINRIGLGVPILGLSLSLLGLGAVYILGKAGGYMEDGFLTSNAPKYLENLDTNSKLLGGCSILFSAIYHGLGIPHAKKVREYLNKYKEFEERLR